MSVSERSAKVAVIEIGETWLLSAQLLLMGGKRYRRGPPRIIKTAKKPYIKAPAGRPVWRKSAWGAKNTRLGDRGLGGSDPGRG